MTEEIVKLSNVYVERDGVVILEDNSLCVHKDDFLGIIGPNGGGKTTLLKVILGLVRPSSGSVVVFGDTPLKTRQRIGYVPQFSSFDRDFPISVRDTVLMGRLCRKKMMGFYSDEDRGATENALDTLEIRHLSGRKIGDLSGGERQRVLIARALAGEPRLLILDEPTASVDPKMKTGVYEILAGLKSRMAIILVTHDIGAISSHVGKVACLNTRLFYHDSNEVPPGVMDTMYQCPVDLLAHGVPHRVLKEHGRKAQ